MWYGKLKGRKKYKDGKIVRRQKDEKGKEGGDRKSKGEKNSVNTHDVLSQKQTLFHLNLSSLKVCVWCVCVPWSSVLCTFHFSGLAFHSIMTQHTFPVRCAHTLLSHTLLSLQLPLPLLPVSPHPFLLSNSLSSLSPACAL